MRVFTKFLAVLLLSGVSPSALAQEAFVRLLNLTPTGEEDSRVNFEVDGSSLFERGFGTGEGTEFTPYKAGSHKFGATKEGFPKISSTIALQRGEAQTLLLLTKEEIDEETGETREVLFWEQLPASEPTTEKSLRFFALRAEKPLKVLVDLVERDTQKEIIIQPGTEKAFPIPANVKNVLLEHEGEKLGWVTATTGGEYAAFLYRDKGGRLRANIKLNQPVATSSPDSESTETSEPSRE